MFGTIDSTFVNQANQMMLFIILAVVLAAAASVFLLFGSVGLMDLFFHDHGLTQEPVSEQQGTASSSKSVFDSIPAGIFWIVLFSAMGVFYLWTAFDFKPYGWVTVFLLSASAFMLAVGYFTLRKLLREVRLRKLRQY